MSPPASAIVAELRARDIEFVSMVGSGYIMRPHDKARVRELIEVYEAELAPATSGPVLAFSDRGPSAAAGSE